jgi:polyisoprenyl-phosphate glycosyltransferase
MRTLDVICPVYNEADVIADFYRALRRQLDDFADRYRSRIIFVVDRSTDATESIIQDLCSRDPALVLISLSARFGHQMSLVAGMDHSTADWCVMMDSDLEHPPAVIPDLLLKAEEGYDVVYTVRQYAAEVSYAKRVTSSLYYRFISAMSNLSMQPGSADFRLISGKVRDVFKHSIREQNPFLRGLVSWVGFRSTHVTFRSETRKAGTSKYRPTTLIKFAAVGIISFSRKPLRLAIYAGFATALVALAALAYHLYAWLRYSNLPQGWTTLALLISMIGSVQLLILGIIGEYLGFIFAEVKRRPLYIVDRTINA